MEDNRTEQAGGTGVQTAGDIHIRECVIIRSDGQELDIRQFIGELNIFEDIFKNGLYGNLLVIDAANLTQNFPIVGEEFIRLHLETPSMATNIRRTFKIYSITDRIMLRDTNTQSYVLHFTSPEIFVDILSPVYGTFEGTIDEVVAKIFTENLSTSRNGEDNDNTPLIVLPATENRVKFTSPGWTPMHCLNWLASKAIAVGYKSPNYLFYESNQAFYFTNIEALIDNSINNKSYYQQYIYMANNITQNPNEEGYVKDIEKEYQKIEDMELISSYNTFKNAQNGYYANRLVTMDIFNKKYEVFDYDHVSSYDEYSHLENISGVTNVAPFKPDTFRSPAGFIQFATKHKNLFTDFDNNVGDVVENVLPRRVSVINELSNFKLILTVPGRVDAEVGNIIYFSYPDTSPRDEKDSATAKEDTYYSGFYLVTAIRHKITLLKHMMIMEVVKDSYHKEPGQ